MMLVMPCGSCHSVSVVKVKDDTETHRSRRHITATEHLWHVVQNVLYLWDAASVNRLYYTLSNRVDVNWTHCIKFAFCSVWPVRVWCVKQFGFIRFILLKDMGASLVWFPSLSWSRQIAFWCQISWWSTVCTKNYQNLFIFYRVTQEMKGHFWDTVYIVAWACYIATTLSSLTCHSLTITNCWYYWQHFYTVSQKNTCQLWQAVVSTSNNW